MNRGRLLNATLMLTLTTLACTDDSRSPGTDPPPSSWTTEPALIDNDSVQVIVATVAPEFFEAVQVLPYLGRRFIAQDYGGDSRPAILSHAYWSSHFDGRPDVIGSSIKVADVARIIVGVMPPGFEAPDDVAIWIPAAAPADGPGN